MSYLSCNIGCEKAMIAAFAHTNNNRNTETTSQQSLTLFKCTPKEFLRPFVIVEKHESTCTTLQRARNSRALPLHQTEGGEDGPISCFPYFQKTYYFRWSTKAAISAAPMERHEKGSRRRWAWVHLLQNTRFFVFLLHRFPLHGNVWHPPTKSFYTILLFYTVFEQSFFPTFVLNYFRYEEKALTVSTFKLWTNFFASFKWK